MPPSPRTSKAPPAARAPAFPWHEFVLRFPGAPADGVDAALGALGRMVYTVMRGRGLWSAPPAWLGYDGGRRWRRDEVWDALVVDVFIEAVLEPVATFRMHATRGARIDGMIWRNVYHFVTERQRAHDRVGYAVFGVVSAALLALATRGAVTVRGLGPSGEVTNRATVTLAPPPGEDALPRAASRAALTCASPGELREALRAIPVWDAVVHQLASLDVAARDALAGCIVEVARRGVAAFQVKALVDAVKGEVRPRYAAFVRDSLAPEGAAPALPARWAEVTTAVPVAIERSPHQPALRRDLLALFDLCRRCIEAGDDVPRVADLVRHLRRPRGTVVYHLTLLGQILKAIDGAP